MKAALIAFVVLAAAPVAAIAARHPPPPSAPVPAPIVKDGLEISILPQVGAGMGADGVTSIGIDIEAKAADAATRLGFRSLHAVADIDCGKRQNRFVSAEAFDQPALAGPSRSRNVTGQWVEPTSDSYMAAVITQVCAAARTTTTTAANAHPLPVVRELAQAPPPKAAAPPPAQVAVSAPAPAAAPAPAGPAPEAAAAPAPPPSGPLVVKFGGLPAGARAETSAAAAAPPGPASYIPKTAGDRIAQVSASPSQQQAEKVLRQLRPLIASPLTTTIELATVGAAHVWRADVVGFATAADAKAFCKAAAHVSKTCWVRAKGDAPAKAEAAPLRGLKPAPPRRAPAPAPRRAG